MKNEITKKKAALTREINQMGDYYNDLLEMKEKQKDRLKDFGYVFYLGEKIYWFKFDQVKREIEILKRKREKLNQVKN